MIFIGFTAVNVYSLYLGSFMISFIKISDFEIVGAKSYMNISSNTYQVTYITFLEYLRNFLELNKNCGYLIFDFMWRFNPVLKDTFHLAKSGITNAVFSAAYVEKKSPHWTNLYNFYLQAHEHGFIDQWTKNIFKVGNGTRSLSLRILTRDYLSLILKFYCGGLFVSLLVFIFWELLLSRISFTITCNYIQIKYA